MNDRASPELSVVIASPYSFDDLDQLLQSLDAQRHGRAVEIIVGNSCQEPAVEMLIARYSDVTFLRYARRTPLPELWGAGIARSQGRIIAITDSTCAICPDWIEAILRAHQSTHPVIGGAMEPTPLRSSLDWSAYFCEYGQFMHPLKAGVAQELPGNNISFKREALGLGREFAAPSFYKTYWCRHLQAEGVALISDPSIVAGYRKSYRLIPFLIRRFHHGRCFAGMRNRQLHVLRRLVYAAGCGVLPFLFLSRIARAILPKRRFMGEFLLSTPHTILAVASWSLGEFVGYLLGPANSCDHIY